MSDFVATAPPVRPQVTWRQFADYLAGVDRTAIVRAAWQAHTDPYAVPAEEASAAVASVLSWTRGRRTAEATRERRAMAAGPVDVVVYPLVTVHIDDAPHRIFVHEESDPMDPSQAAALLELLSCADPPGRTAHTPAILDVSAGRLLTVQDCPLSVQTEESVMGAARRLAVQWARFGDLWSRMNIYAYLPDGFDIPSWDLEQISWEGVRDIVDVGCGTGRHLRRLRGADMRIVAVDPSPNVLRHTRLSGAPALWGCVTGDLMALPLSTASFDVALAMHMLYNVPDMEVGVRELRRVLRPGGRALVSTRGRDHFHEFDLLFTDAVPGSSDREPLEGNSPLNGRFLLENGATVLRAGFASVERRESRWTLRVPETEAVVRYVESTRHWREALMPDGVGWAEAMGRIRERVAADVAKTGAFEVTYHEGLFVCGT